MRRCPLRGRLGAGDRAAPPVDEPWHRSMEVDDVQPEGLDHIALTVSDVARSIAWYQEVLGLERRYQEVWGDMPAVLVGANGSGLALFASRGPAPAPDVRATLVARHIAFRVGRATFERARADLPRQGIAVEHQHHTVSESIYFRDPDGHQIELTTYELG